MNGLRALLLAGSSLAMLVGCSRTSSVQASASSTSVIPSTAYSAVQLAYLKDLEDNGLPYATPEYQGGEQLVFAGQQACRLLPQTRSLADLALVTGVFGAKAQPAILQAAALHFCPDQSGHVDQLLRH